MWSLTGGFFFSFFFQLRKNSHNIKITINHLKMHISVALSTFHNVVKPSPLSTPRIILSPQKERREGRDKKKGENKYLLF